MRILSIDGGGIRGIIPALVLAELEERTGRRDRRAVRPHRRDLDRRHPRLRAHRPRRAPGARARRAVPHGGAADLPPLAVAAGRERRRPDRREARRHRPARGAGGLPRDGTAQRRHHAGARDGLRPRGARALLLQELAPATATRRWSTSHARRPPPRRTSSRSGVDRPARSVDGGVFADEPGDVRLRRGGAARARGRGARRRAARLARDGPAHPRRSTSPRPRGWGLRRVGAPAHRRGLRRRRRHRRLPARARSWARARTPACRPISTTPATRSTTRARRTSSASSAEATELIAARSAELDAVCAELLAR